MSRHALLCLFLTPIFLTAGEPVLDHCGSGAAVAEANRAALLALLQRTDAPLIIGQQVGHPGDCEAGYRENIADAAAAWGNRVPLMIGIDYGWEVMDPAGIKRANALVLAHWRRGGLVTLNMDPTNPTTQAGLRSPTGFDPQATLIPGTVSHQRWMADLTAVADGLAELQGHGVAVLWRPLHEANGGWFWWGTNGTSTETYRRLWEHMHTYFTEQRRLNNLLWVYSPNSSTHASSVTDHYPGATLVDVVALDVYADRLDSNAFGGYQDLVALGKPFALAEIGPTKKGRGTFDAVDVVTAIRTHCPKARWALWWNSWGGKGWFNPRQRMSLIENPRAKEMLADPTLGLLLWKPVEPGGSGLRTVISGMFTTSSCSDVSQSSRSSPAVRGP
jgi:mannan endo-1,4-beta-mannosidase